MTLAGLVYFVMALSFRNTAALYLLAAAIIGAGYPLFRKYVFRPVRLETVLDKDAGTVEIFRQGFRKVRESSFPVSEIREVVIESRKPELSNPDGVDFVRKISHQHGTVIPGFGEETVLFLLKLVLIEGEEKIIHVDDRVGDAISAHGEIKGFLEEMTRRQRRDSADSA